MSSFRDVNEHEVRAILEFLMKILEVAQLATENVSAKTAKDQHNGHFPPEAGQLNFFCGDNIIQIEIRC